MNNKNPRLHRRRGFFNVRSLDRSGLDAVEEARWAIEEEDVINIFGDRTQVGVLGACVVVETIRVTLRGGVHRGGWVPTDGADVTRVARAA